jgi:hypothetical protein
MSLDQIATSADFRADRDQPAFVVEASPFRKETARLIGLALREGKAAAGMVTSNPTASSESKRVRDGEAVHHG